MEAGAHLSQPPTPLTYAVPASQAFHQHRTLLLNADYQPIGFPLETLNAEDTIRGLFMGRYQVVEWSNIYAHSPSMEMRLPSVVALREYIAAANLHLVPTCNLHNLYVRDRGLCQYTGQPLRLNSSSKEFEATVDHVIPRAHQGHGNWDNVVLASWQANNRKGHKKPEQVGLTLRTMPWTPTGADLLYLWLTEEKLHGLPQPWHEFLLRLKPTPRLQRVLQTLAAA